MNDRKQLWQLLHALDCFQQVDRICVHIQEHAITNGHPLYHSLLTSLFVLYGRPFKKAHGIGPMPDDIVPTELRAVHEDLVTHRDKIFAHTDVDGRWEVEGLSLNQVELTIQNGYYNWRVRTIHPMPERITEIRSLCAVLIPKVNYHINKMNQRFAKFAPRTNGTYRLVLDPNAKAAFEPIQDYQ